MAGPSTEMTSILYSLEGGFFSHSPQLLNRIVAAKAASEAKKLLTIILDSNADNRAISAYVQAVFNAQKNHTPAPDDKNITTTAKRNIDSLLTKMKTFYCNGNKELVKDFNKFMRNIHEQEKSNGHREYCSPKQEFIGALAPLASHYLKTAANTEQRTAATASPAAA